MPALAFFVSVLAHTKYMDPANVNAGGREAGSERVSASLPPRDARQSPAETVPLEVLHRYLEYECLEC